MSAEEMLAALVTAVVRARCAGEVSNLIAQEALRSLGEGRGDAAADLGELAKTIMSEAAGMDARVDAVLSEALCAEIYAEHAAQDAELAFWRDFDGNS